MSHVDHAINVFVSEWLPLSVDAYTNFPFIIPTESMSTTGAVEIVKEDLA